MLWVTSSVSTTEPLSTHDVTLGDVDGTLFHIKFVFSWGIMTNMGKIEGIFLNLQCDCHRVASIFIKTDRSTYQFQHLAARFDSAMNKWTLLH